MGRIRRGDELRIVVAGDGCSRRRPNRQPAVARRIEFRQRCRRVQPQRPVLVGERLLQRGNGFARAILSQSVENRGPRVDRCVALRQRVRGAKRIAAPRRLHLSNDLRGGGAHGKVGLLQQRQRDVGGVRGLEVREPAEHRRKHALVLVAEHRLHAPEGDLCRQRREHGRERRTNAPLGIGVHARQHEAKLSGSIDAAARSAAARIAGQGSESRSCTSGKPSADFSAPRAVTTSRRTFGSVAGSEASSTSGGAAAGSPRLPRALIADTFTSSGVRACWTSAFSGATAARALITPRPRAANAAVYFPGTASSFSRTGAARGSSMRPSA